MKKQVLELVPHALTSVGLIAFVLTFLLEMSSFREAVTGWARRDLATRTELAAANLMEPLATGDFRRIHEMGDACSEDGVRLVIKSGPNGVFFDSARVGEAQPDSIYASSPCGEYSVTLGLPVERVLAPFYRARLGFLLAALAGGAGVLLVFFSAYRQSLRIRELKRVEKFRRDFIADVSHEIKTPLTGIMGAVDMLDDFEKIEPDARRTLLGLLKKESVRLDALARNILSLSRLERAGEAESLHLEETDVAELVSDTVMRFKDMADKAGVTISVCGLDGASPVRCDAQLVQQAVSNLIANALLHSGSKDVVVSVASSHADVTISVEDHGVGIPHEKRERVFERFYRMDSSRASGVDGSGLGLAIVREIARLHGGDVKLEDAHPSGCVFSLRLGR